MRRAAQAFPVLRPAGTAASTHGPWRRGAAPYTFEWTVDGQPVGDGSSTLTFANSGSSFLLGVLARDANGFTGANAKSVAISWSAPECLDQ